MKKHAAKTCVDKTCIARLPLFGIAIMLEEQPSTIYALGCELPCGHDGKHRCARAGNTIEWEAE